MKVTPKRAIYAVISAAGLIALAVDKLPSGPDRADGSIAGAVLGDGATAGAAAPATSPIKIVKSASSLSVSLKALAKGEGLDPLAVSDVFVPSKRWMPATPAPVQHAKPAGEDFVKTHVLSALVQSAKGGTAVIDGHMLKVGDVVDGYKLLSVSRYAAYFTNDSVSIELHMKDTSDNADTAPQN